MNTGDLFGSSVAISGDGLRFVVGAPLEDTTATTSGAAYVFTLSSDGTTVSQEALLKGVSPVLGDDFGGSVALNQGGTTLAVGAKERGGKGEVSIFTYTGTWSTATAITGLAPNATAAGDKFGASVSLSDAGTTPTLAVGAPAATSTGLVYIFTGATFGTQQAVLTASNAGSGDQFGSSVSLSQSGDTLIVGAPEEDSNATSTCSTACSAAESDNSATSTGAAYRFSRESGVWTQKTYIKATNTGAGDQFGFSVAVSNNEIVTTNVSPFTQTLVIGAPFEDGSTPGVYKGSVILPPDANSTDNFGAAYLH